jgi:Cd2+/Zn2+-exporting ATPase
LRREPGIEAVRLDPAGRKISVATLGPVDLDRLRRKLDLIIEGHRADIEKKTTGIGRRPGGFSVFSTEAGTTLQRDTCKTAPRLWSWRDLDWPEDEREAESPEWKLLAVLATICGGLSIIAYGLEKTNTGPGWLAPSLFIVAMLAGGWDALGDV